MKLQNSLASLQTRASDSGLAFWGEGSGERGDDDDIVMQTPRTTSPEEPFYLVLQYFPDVGPIVLWTLRTRHWALRGLSAKTRNWKGGSLFFTRYFEYFGHVVVHC